MLFLKIICTNYKENIAADHFMTSTFQAVDYPKPARFVWSYTWHVAKTPHQSAFVSSLGQGRH